MHILYEFRDFVDEGKKENADFLFIVRNIYDVKRVKEGDISEIDCQYEETKYYPNENNGKIFLDTMEEFDNLPISMVVIADDLIHRIPLFEKNIEKIEDGYKIFASLTTYILKK